jgi:hypothetical protein
MLLNLLETGMLVSTKVRKTQEMEFKGIKLFATSNDIEQLSKKQTYGISPTRVQF